MDFYGGRRNADIFLSTYFEIKERKVDGKDSFSRVNLANLNRKRNLIEADPKFTLFYLTFFKSISKNIQNSAHFQQTENRVYLTKQVILTIEGNTMNIDP